MIKLENIKKSVPGLEILKDISLSFEQGMTFIVGDSGAGKSTLMNIISTMDVPTEGRVCYELGDTHFEYSAASGDEEISRFRAGHLGIIFQDFNLIGDMSGAQNLQLGRALAGSPSRADEIADCLAGVNLPGQAEKLMNVMSGGERQRVAIARALYKDAEIILADEPTGNLDEKNTIDIFTKLKEISQERIVIVISHNLEMAQKYGDRILFMKDGMILRDEIKKAAKEGQEKKKTLRKNTPHRKDQEQVQKSGIPKDLIRSFALNNIRKFRSKFLSMVLVMGIVLAGAGICFSMNHLLSNEVDAMNYLYYDADQVTIYKSNTQGDRAQLYASNLFCGITISPEEEERVKTLMGFAEAVPADYWGYGIVDDRISEKVSIKPIRLNGFFQKRLMSDQIEGHFPADKNEIIIGEDISKKLFDGGGIGESLTLGDKAENFYTFTVCGINHAKNVDGIYYCYAPYDRLMEGDAVPQNYGELTLKEEVWDRDPNRSGTISAAWGYYTDSYAEEELVAGRLPAAPGELAVDINMLMDLYYAIKGERLYHSLEEIRMGKAETAELLRVVFEHDYYLGLNDAYAVKVVGLHDRGGNIFFAEESWLETATRKRPNCLECYFGDMKRTMKADFSKLPYDFDYKSFYLERFDTAVESQLLWQSMFVFVAILSLVTVFALANSYARVTLSERVYEIGVIKSLGGDKKDLARLLRADQIYLGGGAGLLAAGLYLLTLLVFRLLRKGVMSSWLLTLGVTAGLILCGLLCCLLFSRGKIAKAAKTRPIEDFRRRM